MGWRHVKVELLDQARQTRRLPFWQVQHQPGERGRVDDRVLEWALETAPDEPRVESVMAVLDEHRALREAKEASPRVPELRGANEHRAVDVMPLARVGVDRRAAVDQGVKERQGAGEAEALGADLEDEERSVAGRLHVEGDELGVRKRRLGRDLRRVDGDLFPGDKVGCSARLEVERRGGHQRAIASARRAHAISSRFSARRRSTATA